MRTSFGAMAGSVSRVFAALAPASDFIYRDENESGRGDRRPTPRQPIPGREVQVTGSAELSAPPDRARLNLWVSSRKESVTDVKNSVSRRLDYILQVTRQHGVKEENVTVTKDIRRVENAYHMEVEKRTSATITLHITALNNLRQMRMYPGWYGGIVVSIAASQYWGPGFNSGPGVLSVWSLYVLPRFAWVSFSRVLLQSKGLLRRSLASVNNLPWCGGVCVSVPARPWTGVLSRVYPALYPVCFLG
ncbi:interleukin-1 receptor-associated kinase 1-binding protein 1 homolog isoform X2 [Lepisosteus oculatus]|uniref:interleukin-1 receptor-associated kinase 1-binding protein 1 homolog isoform X2 n=1 Tax=Lepisosteus oculatus TaxID=7918 RepID=UPI0035F52531